MARLVLELTAGTDLFAKYGALVTIPGPLVLDRSFVSELVYGPLERGGSRLSLDQAAHLAANISDRHGVLVHLTGRPDRITARLLARDGYAPAEENVSSLNAGYADVFEQLAMHATVLTIDTTNGAYTDFPDGFTF